ncbi:MAG: acyl-CoA dehydrogenase [Actinomycetota bacterium]|nr:MAG: acyl-CoA dehydrogenase [Actinomycetota bacterium]
MKREIYGEEHLAFRDSVRQTLARHVEPNLESFFAAKALPRELWLALGAQGLLSLDVPEQYGGMGANDYRFNAILNEELARVTPGLASCVSIHFDVVAPYLVELGTEDQKQRWLPAFCTGELVTAIAMTEPSGGSDLAALRTSAVRRGDTWVVNGSKTFITNGASADLVIVAARTNPNERSKGITLFAVEATAKGFQRGRKLDKVGQAESDTSELFFDDLVLTDADVIGEVDRGFIHMMERLPQERIGAAVANLAHATAILAETLEYVRERRAFGQPIGSFQHNKFVLAELATKIDVTQAYVDNAVRAHAEGNLSAVDAAKAKWWSAEIQNEVMDACLQLYGGYGYMNEYRVARAWRDARITKIWAGSNEIMKEIIGRDLGL